MPSTSSIASTSRPVDLLGAVDGDDVGVGERGDGLRFATEALAPAFVGREFIGNDLQREKSIEPRISRLVHLAHASGADEAQDIVRAEPGAGGEGHEREYSVRLCCQLCAAAVSGRSRP